MKNQRTINIFAGIGLISLIGLGVFSVHHFFFDSDASVAQNTVSANAESIMETCADVTYRPTCYEDEVPKLLDILPLKDVFEVIRIVKAKDRDYRFCHVLAHELGEREVAKDPKNWIDVIAKGPSDGLCSNGFIHGAAVARFSKEVLTDEEIDATVPELSVACEARDGWDPTPLDQAMCYHGVGHVLLHLTGARVEKSLEVCDRIGAKEDGRDYTELCDEGVFMQIFQPLEPEDHALIDELPMQPTKDNLASFCRRFGGDAAEESACWREGWPFFSEELRTPEGIADFCAAAPNEEGRQDCLTTVLTIQGRHGLNDPETLSDLCNNLPTSEMQRTCFNVSAAAYIEEDKSASEDAVAFCAYATDASVEDACYERLVNVANFVFGEQSPHIDELCRALPDGSHTAFCEDALLQ